MVKAIPHPYQEQSIQFILDHPRTLQILDMGLGKTLITLTALKILGVQKKLEGNILILAPKRVAINTWPAEIEKWDHLKGTPYTLLTGLSKQKREQIFTQIADKTTTPRIYIANHDLTTKIIDYFQHDWPFPTVVIDEVHYYRSAKSARTKAMIKINPKIKRIIGLTGTPAPNYLTNLWSVVAVIDGGQRLGRNITTYLKTFFWPGRRTPQGVVYEWIPKHDAEKKIYQNINDITLSMKAIDHLKMPDIIYNDVIVEMGSKEKEVYKQLRNKHVLHLTDDEVLQAQNAAVLAGKLFQLANGAVYNNDDSKQNKDILVLHDHKLNAAEEIIENIQGQPVIIFYWFEHDLTRLKTRFPDAHNFKGTPDEVTKWNNKEIPILLVHPKSSAEGLNLQEGGHHIIWFSLTWELNAYQQGITRLYRQGQKHTTIVHNIITKGTIDEKIQKDLHTKSQIQERLYTATKK